MVVIAACASRTTWPEKTRAPERTTATSAAGQTQQLTLEVAPYRVPCTGEAPTRCLRIRLLPDTAWQLFYDPIEGFAFEEGYRWVIDVERRRVPNPPADGSGLAYRLKRVLSKQPAQR